MIHKAGSKWVLYTRDGDRVLGTHDSKADALRQERAILASEGRRKAKKAAKKRARRD
jgi:hypothetical protein